MQEIFWNIVILKAVQNIVIYEKNMDMKNHTILKHGVLEMKWTDLGRWDIKRRKNMQD